MSPFSDMPSALRIESFRALAAEARRLARHDACGEREQFLHFARQWDKLATALQADLRRRLAHIELKAGRRSTGKSARLSGFEQSLTAVRAK